MEILTLADSRILSVIHGNGSKKSKLITVKYSNTSGLLLNPTFARGKSFVGMNGSLPNVLGRECDSNHAIPSTQKCPSGPKKTFSPFLVKNGSFLGAHHGSKKGYLEKTTAEKASVGPKLSKYNRGNDFGKIFFLSFFSPSSNFFQNVFS